MQQSESFSVREWILWPAIISLAITLLRLIGELLEWPEPFFSRQAGGGFSPLGIVWLVPLLGIYWSWKLCRTGHGPPSPGKSLGILALILVGSILVFSLINVFLGFLTIASILVSLPATLLIIWLATKPWPQLGRLLLAYGVAARIPVAVVMLFAIFGNWGTHYDVPPPGEFPYTSPLAKWVVIGLLPQMTSWIAFTCIIGGIFGSITAFFARSSPRVAAEQA